MTIVAGVAWFGVMYWVFSDTLRDVQAPGGVGIRQWFFVAIGAISLFIIARGLSGLLKRRVANIDRSFVNFSGRILFFKESWREPLQNYSGIGHREGRIARRNHSATYQIIELLHAHADKTILLDVIRGTEPPQQRSEAFAQALQLSLVDEGGHSRAVSDLDKPLRQQVQEGAVEASYDPAGSVPAGLSVARRIDPSGDVILIILSAPRLPGWIMIGFVVVPFFIAALSVMQIGVSAGAIIVLLIAAGAIWFRRYERANPRTLEVTRKEVILHDVFNGIGGPGRRAALSHDEIEQIYVSGSRGQVLSISSDRLTLSTGSGLSLEALNWLKAYLTAAIANA